MDDKNLNASVFIENKGNVWMDDNFVTNCLSCGVEFSFYERKHHCRSCGNIFCYKCANQYVVIPKFITDKPKAADYWNPSYYISAIRSKEERVCKKCFDDIREKMNAQHKIQKIYKNPITLDDIKELPNSDSDLKNHYFHHLRNIQYYLPNHTYSDFDKKLLRINAPYFCKHSKYLMHYIKSMEWDSIDSIRNKDQIEFLSSIINGEKVKKCDQLFCTRTCQEQLSIDDCINIIYSCHQKLPNDIIKYLFDIIMDTPEEQVILCHLPFFINIIKKRSATDFIHSLVYNLLVRTQKLIYHTYWFLNNAKKEASQSEFKNINDFIDLFDEDMVKKMNKEYLFYAGLVDNLDDPKRYLISNFKSFRPITLPYNPEIQLVDYESDSIDVKSSYTKPVIITFITNNSEKIKILFKKECVMNDIIVLNLMTLSDIVLKEASMNNNNFDVIVYPVMPLTPNSGMIEIIDKAETVHSIINGKKTIYQHIFERNEGTTIGKIMDRYMYSLVAYTLHSYFLGLGDRHLQNIMVTDDGAIFHIDFGFILGTDAYPLTASDIKLNSDMLDVIGGCGGERYKEYLNLCSEGIIILRKFFNMFFILLSQNPRFKEKYIEKFVLTRFQPRQSDNIVVTELMTIIKKSHNAYHDLIRDFIHYHTQEQTVQNGFGKIFGAIYGTVKHLTNSGGGLHNSNNNSK